MSLEIYIEGNQMDLGDKAIVIARTLQHFEFLKLGGSVKAEGTNRLTLPLSNPNKIALEMIAPLSVITAKPYRTLSIVIVQDGITMPQANCQIISLQGEIKLDVQGIVKDFFDLMDGLYLNDIDLSSYNGLWDNDRHDTTRNTTSGLVCPVTSNGQLVDSTTYVDGYTYGSAMIPFFYYHTIMTQMSALLGKTFSGSVFADANRYLKMVMSTRFVYNQKFIDDNTIVIARSNVSIPAAGYVYPRSPLYPAGTLAVDTEKFLSYDSSIVGGIATKIVNGTGIAPFCKIRVTYTCKIALTAGAINQITGVIFNTSSVQITTSSVVNSDILTLTADLYSLGERVTTGGGPVDSLIYVGLRNNDGISTANITNGVFKLELLNTTNTDRLQATDWHWEFSKLLPRIPLKTFVKDFMKMFCLAVRETNGNVEFKYFKDIANDTTPTSIELSREDKSQEPIKRFTPNGFGQSNNYWWIVQDDELVIADEYGKGVFTLDNDLLPSEIDQYTSIFTASNQITEKRINQAAQITIYDQSVPGFTKAADFGSRLLLLRDDDGVNFRFKSGTSRTDYFIGYFIDKNQTYNLSWQEFLNEFYPEYTDMLNRYTEIEQKYLITLVELKQVDLFKLKEKDGVTYLLEKIENFKKGEFAKFKLIKR
jgi:hypothetical protein